MLALCLLSNLIINKVINELAAYTYLRRFKEKNWAVCNVQFLSQLDRRIEMCHCQSLMTIKSFALYVQFEKYN